MLVECGRLRTSCCPLDPLLGHEAAVGWEKQGAGVLKASASLCKWTQCQSCLYSVSQAVTGSCCRQSTCCVCQPGPGTLWVFP